MDNNKVKEFATAILHGDEVHKEWLLEAADKFVKGEPVPEPRQKAVEHEWNHVAYVVGFLFRNDDKEVALIKKLKPDWMKGKLNGVGGKIEAGESPLVAMRREFKEETGADVKNWHNFLSFNEPFIGFFISREPAEIRTVEAEEVNWYPVEDIRHLNTIPNLEWLIPLAKCPERINAYITKERTSPRQLELKL